MTDVTRIREDDELIFERQYQQAKDWYAGICGRTLRKHYPFNNWLVDIRLDKTGGIAYLREPNISMKFGMVVYLTESIPALEYEVMKAGGELLERFKLPRAGQVADRLAEIKRDPLGEAVNAEKGEA